MRKAKRNLLFLVSFAAALAALVFLFLARNRPFQGKVEAVREEYYRVGTGIVIPLVSEVGTWHRVERIAVRTRKGKVLDLAVYGSDLGQESVGRFIKGSFRRGKMLKIRGEKIILGIIGFPGTRIELTGKPDGMIKKYRIIH